MDALISLSAPRPIGGQGGIPAADAAAGHVGLAFDHGTKISFAADAEAPSVGLPEMT
jgi:hypothetical protein